MPSPAKVCHMAPLNTVLKCDEDLLKSSSTQDASLDELLRRCEFDRAEDVEDTAVNCHLPMAAIPRSSPKAKWYDESFPTLHCVPTGRSGPSFSPLYEEIWDERSGWAHGTAQTASSPSEDQTESNETTSSCSSYESLLPRNEFGRDRLSRTAESEDYSFAQQCVDNIFADRQAWIEADEEIHHFNWMGIRAYTHSSTSPSDSLAIILAKPKNPQGSAIWRIQSLLSRAHHYIDPVLVLMDGTDNGLFELRGSELVRASTGRVFKFYSPHGTWLEDPNDSSEETTTDFGNVRTYDTSHLAFGNGFVESSPISSVAKWLESRDKAFDGPGIQRPRRMTWERKPSPLSRCESIWTEITPQEIQPVAIKGPKKPPCKITTCVIGAPPEEYFSFPTPVFSRRRAIKQAFAKARQGLASVLTSLKDKLT
ncbi:unnamed protein product [Penicillium egyptiacum]|uniref:Uncharacterized protein n=1 Tax=Penicillium egyptiacum TaxID=1303716 RepID=A0A9W4P921_9EURO|nr:unnamed protein product [Penicillium egyptiacum]